MPTDDRQTLGCFVRCHARADTLEILLKELLRYDTFPGVRTKISIWADRPTWRVARVLDSYRDRVWGLRYSPFPLVSASGRERYMEALELQRQDLERTECTWYGLFDDDRWPEPYHITSELPAALGDDSVDLWYAHSVFFEDKPTAYNPARQHCSPLLWRVLPGDRFPLNRTIQATEHAHDAAIISGRVGTLKTPLLDYGTFSLEERERLTSIYAQAGKSDAYTASYLAPTGLCAFPVDAVAAGLMPDTNWRDLYSEFLYSKDQTATR